MSSQLRILVLGDVIGRPGIRAVVANAGALRRRYKADLLIVNGENADDGFGLSSEIADQLLSAGADVITSGNHIWQNDAVEHLLESDRPVLRPANYPAGCPGKGHVMLFIKQTPICVVNLQGRVRMPLSDCPFRKFREIKKKELSKTKIVVVDFHAEATEEKEAMALSMDGSVTLFYGTHTHIQTADERIFPKGTAYITDIGATGAEDSVIGFDPQISITRSISQVPHKNTVLDAPAMLQGVFVIADADSGKALHVERVREVSGV